MSKFYDYEVKDELSLLAGAGTHKRVGKAAVEAPVQFEC